MSPTEFSVGQLLHPAYLCFTVSFTCPCAVANFLSAWRTLRRWTESCWTRLSSRCRPTQRPWFLHQSMTRSPFVIPRCPHSMRTGNGRSCLRQFRVFAEPEQGSGRFLRLNHLRRHILLRKCASKIRFKAILWSDVDFGVGNSVYRMLLADVGIYHPLIGTPMKDSPRVLGR